MPPVIPSPTKRGPKFAWPRIRTITEKSGAVHFRVDAGRWPTKARNVKQFKTLAEADAHAADLRTKRETQAKADRYESLNRAVNLTKLTDEQRADVLAAIKGLAGTKGSLSEAVSFWRAHAAPANAKSVIEVHTELIAAMETANRRPRSITEIRTRISGFFEKHGDRPIASITTNDVETWLNTRCKGLAARTRHHFLRVLHRLFQFAVKRGYREGNPVAVIDKPTTEQTRPEIFTPPEVCRLLAKATELRPGIVPYLALGLFAGLRSSELIGLDWKHIDLARREIHVDSAVAKKRRARYVKIEPNLLAWLTPYRQEEGLVLYSRAAIRLVIEKAKLRWPHNALRHSFGSYHLAAFEDSGRTAAQLGHAGDASQLFNHYRALVRKQDALAYWDISPNIRKVIPFSRAAAST